MSAPIAYRIPDAAEAIGVSAATLRREIRAGRIRTVHIGRRVVVPASELHRITTDALTPAGWHWIVNRGDAANRGIAVPEAP